MSKEVKKSLGYLQDVLDKNILALLAGSVTVVLETVMELSQLISNYTQITDRWVKGQRSEVRFDSLDPGNETVMVLCLFVIITRIILILLASD